MKLFLIIGAFATLVITANAAQQCFKCVYYEDAENTNLKDVSNQKCNDDNVPVEFLVNCDDDTTPVKEDERAPGSDAGDWQCVKKNGKTKNADDDEFKYVSRYCARKSEINENTCKESNALDTEVGLGATKGYKCFCNKNECNGASQIGNGIISLIIVFVVVAFNRV